MKMIHPGRWAKCVGVPLLLLAGPVLSGGIAASEGEAPDSQDDPPPRVPYHSPLDVAFSLDASYLAASDPPTGTVWIVERESMKASPIRVQGEPRGLAWTPEGRLLVAEYGAQSVAEIDLEKGAVVRRLAAGRYPKGIALAPSRKLMLVANSATHTVSFVDLATGEERQRVAVPRQPMAISLTPDESMAVVTNQLPAGRADRAGYGAVLSLFDLNSPGERRDVQLPAGSTDVHDVAVDGEGRWAYAVHIVGRTNVPTTQLERGWINTNAMSIIDLEAGTVYATLLLDHPLEGAADPWGIEIAPDGKTIWITISGVHQLARIELELLHEYLAGGLPDDHPLADTGSYTSGTENIWLRIKRDPAQRAELVNDLAALHAADLIDRIDLEVKGPRGLDISPDGQTVAVAAYFTGSLLLIDAATSEPRGQVALGATREPDVVRLGEVNFHDATLCFQHWLSCATCHPNEARVDGMNWDLLNDGLGNPKNLKSLLDADKTPPMMWRGAREGVMAATRKGFHFLLREPQPGEVESVVAYLSSLDPEPSPHNALDGSPSDATRRGYALFHSDEAGCASCHPAPLYTDLKTHDVGTRGELDRVDPFDTPSLVELYRTGPYLHDGRVATLLEVLTSGNLGDQHGKTSQLDPNQLEDLVAFLLSL